MKISKILTPILGLPLVLGTGLSAMVSCKSMNSAHKITLFANGGAFTGGKTILELSDDGNQKKISELAGYEKPTIDGELTFNHWINGNGETVDENTVISDDLSLQAIYDKEINKFETDEWSTVVSQANQGLDHLKQYYGVNSFIGFERTVNINGLNQKVRVIGENEDYIADVDGSPTEDTAALTFQFVNVLSGIYTDRILPVGVSMGNTSWGWEDSSVRAYLTTTESTDSFANQMNEQLGDGAVQTVSKWSVNWNYEDPASPHSETFFIPSLADIYNEDQINYDIFEDAGFYIEEANHLEDAEEYQGPYSYYRNHIDQDDDFAYTHMNRILALTDCDNFAQSYWLRTAYEDLDPVDYNAHYCIWSDGRRCSNEAISFEGELLDASVLCLTPIFCIGISE